MAGTLINIVGRLPNSLKKALIPPGAIPDVQNDPSKVQLCRISHVYYSHPDLERFSRFATDFGFVEAHKTDDTIYYRGYGKEQYVYVVSRGSAAFGGAAFVAASVQEFEKASRLPGAALRDLDNAPGGGRMVTFTRPNGTFFHVLYGQKERQINTANPPPTKTHESHGPFNSPFEKPRLGQFQRYHDGPALVHKLGHFGYVCKEIDEELDFYTSNFNFVHSDILYLPQLDHVDGITFMHLDLGDEYSDHHCFFMQRAPPGTWKTFVHHSSFEVDDFDTQLMGHHWLANRGWKSVWGVGRHVLGSQIFDYWQDPDGFKVEHYTDGDMVNKDNPTRRSPAGPLSVWGPELPADFGNNSTRWF